MRPHPDYLAPMARNIHHHGSGPSQRQLRVGELIRRTLSEVLMRGEIHDPELNRLSITVAEVRTSPDLRVATAFVMPLGGEHRSEALELLHRHRGELRRAVFRAMAIKHSPELRFEIDETFDRMQATRELFEREDVRRDLEAAPDEPAEGADRPDPDEGENP